MLERAFVPEVVIVRGPDVADNAKWEEKDSKDRISQKENYVVNQWDYATCILPHYISNVQENLTDLRQHGHVCIHTHVVTTPYAEAHACHSCDMVHQHLQSKWCEILENTDANNEVEAEVSNGNRTHMRIKWFVSSDAHLIIPEHCEWLVAHEEYGVEDSCAYDNMVEVGAYQLDRENLVFERFVFHRPSRPKDAVK